MWEYMALNGKLGMSLEYFGKDSCWLPSTLQHLDICSLRDDKVQVTYNVKSLI